MKRILLPTLVLLLLCGCAAPAATSAPPAPPTATLRRPTFTPQPIQPTTTPLPTLPPGCEEWVQFTQGDYQAMNNTWGRGAIATWSQCIELGANDDDSVNARWSWDWPEEGENVKCFPEIIYGFKPGSTPTTDDLPQRIGDLAEFEVTYAVTSTHTGSGMLVLDLWLTDTPTPDTFAAPPITHQVMIWLEAYGGRQPGGELRGQVSLGGSTYDLYTGDGSDRGWAYIAFARREPGLSGTLDLLGLFTHLLEQGLVTPDTYIASIEFGNQVVSGTGETVVERYEVDAKGK